MAIKGEQSNKMFGKTYAICFTNMRSMFCKRLKTFYAVHMPIFCNELSLCRSGHFSTVVKRGYAEFISIVIHNYNKASFIFLCSDVINTVGEAAEFR